MQAVPHNGFLYATVPNSLSRESGTETNNPLTSFFIIHVLWKQISVGGLYTELFYAYLGWFSYFLSFCYPYVLLLIFNVLCYISPSWWQDLCSTVFWRCFLCLSVRDRKGNQVPPGLPSHLPHPRSSLSGNSAYCCMPPSVHQQTENCWMIMIVFNNNAVAIIIHNHYSYYSYDCISIILSVYPWVHYHSNISLVSSYICINWIVLCINVDSMSLISEQLDMAWFILN